MTNKASVEHYGEKETVERREAALKRMLSTPHQPHRSTTNETKKPQKRGASAKRGTSSP